MAKILLTRPQKLSQKISKTLAQENLSPIIQPLFSIVQMANLHPLNQNIQAVLITSQAATFALKKLAIKKDVLILVVGKKTALIVEKLGYQNILTANNSAATLLKLALEKLSDSNGLVVYLSGENITLDLAKKLQEQNFATTRIVAYKIVESEKFTDTTIEEIKKGNIIEIWFYSQNTVSIFYKLAKKHNLLGYLREIKILCLSQKIIDFVKEKGFLQAEIIKEKYE